MSEWWWSAVIYQVYVRSFADANGDGIGDLPGVRSRLPYLRDLGVDGLWLTPFYPSPGADHGYDVSDYTDVDPQFGTLADFDALVEDAHELDLRVVIDVVPNHTQDLHDMDEPVPRTWHADWVTAINQPELHPLYQRWRAIANEYPGERMFVGEIVLKDLDTVARYVRPHQLQLAFNFALLHDEWDEQAMRDTIDRTLSAFGRVTAPSTWVFENHDVTRVPTRYGGGEEGRRRARAAALLLLALPGTAFIYEGQELGLEEVDLPDEARRDPIFFRTQGARKGRDGCRVPVPWESTPPGFGFTTGTPWLPISESWKNLSVAVQDKESGSSLELFRFALKSRHESEALRSGSFRWLESPPGTLLFVRETGGAAIVCAVNIDAESLDLPPGALMLSSEPLTDDRLPPGSAAWVRAT
jgi:alpha-glucosidase